MRGVERWEKLLAYHPRIIGDELREVGGGALSWEMGEMQFLNERGTPVGGSKSVAGPCGSHRSVE